MKCPRCSNKISYITTNCPECGFEFSSEISQKIRFYFNLKNELNNLKAVKENFDSRFLKISSQFEEYENFISNDMKAADMQVADNDITTQTVKPFKSEFMPQNSEDSIEKIETSDNKLNKDTVNAVSEKSGMGNSETVSTQPADTHDEIKALGASVEKPSTSIHDIAAQKKSAFNTVKKPASPASPGIAKQGAGFSAGNFNVSPGNSEDVNFELALGQKWLLVAGIVIVLFGVGYFLKYSFDQNWIGPAGQVALAYLLGAAFLVSGSKLKNYGYDNYGLYLIGGGIATLYFAAFAGFALYTPQLIDQYLSFIIMIVVTLLAGVLAVHHDTKGLAVIGIIGGFLTPILLSTGKDNVYGLMTYMSLLNIGIFCLSFYKKWDLLNTLGFAFTYLLYFGWYSHHYNQEKFWPAVLYLNLFHLIYCFAPFVYDMRTRSNDMVESFKIIAINAFLSFGLNYMIINAYAGKEWVGVVSVIYAVIYLGMASYMLKKQMHKQEAFTVFIAQAALFLIITVPIIFSGHYITIFWAAQAFILFYISQKLERGSVLTSSYVLFIIVTLKFLFYDYTEIFKLSLDHLAFVPNNYNYLIVERYITTILLLCVSYFTGSMARKSFSQFTFSAEVKDSALIFTMWSIVLFIVCNIETSAFFYEYLPKAKFAAVSVLWTIFSICFMGLGFAKNNYTLRKAALGLFGVTIIKVFFYDMANASTPYRIFSFMVLGFILIIASFLYYKFKTQIMSALSGEDKNNENQKRY
ncbi:MAG: DUF2339 domain-containing protein [Candidatus Wallbacteria bacterium]